MAEIEEVRIGVVGYGPQTKFDEEEARRMIVEAYDLIEVENPRTFKAVVSGLTDVGVPAIAYREAVRRGWRTVGIACKKALEYPLYPVDQKKIMGDDWGEESPLFLLFVHAIVRIGGGRQSIAETEAVKKAGKLAIEYDLLPVS